MKRDPRPIVLVIAGNDPTGGAGISADIEAIVSHGCRAAPVVACLTVQDSREVDAVFPVAPELLLRQGRAVIEDLPVAAVKLGLLGNRDLVAAARELIDACPRAPVVCDPVMASGGGGRELGSDLAASLRELILPVTTLTTPNLPELDRLSEQPQASVEAQARVLLGLGCELVLVTGEHAGQGPVRNQMFGAEQSETYDWERLPEHYHGSGCTLAASVAALLARGSDPWSAVHEAQAYTWQTLVHAERPGRGQLLPDRLYWADESWAEEDVDAQA